MSDPPAMPPNPRGPFGANRAEDDLAKRSVRGAAATVAAQGSSFVIALGVTAVLARLLTPSDFGLIAMVGPIMAFAGIFASGGLSHATIQRAEISHAQVSTLFWINVGLGVLLYVVTLTVAPLAARFYNQPEITAITAVLATSLVIQGLGVQHSALLRRQMRFTTLGAIQVTATLTGGITAIAIAYITHSYWSLVAQHLVTIMLTTVIVWLTAGWVPGLARRHSGVRPLVIFGANLTASAFVNYAVRNVDDILIGWRWGPTALGLYTKAYGLLMLPIQQLNWPMGAVALPALSRLQHSPERFRSYYRTAVSLTATGGMPLVAFALVATPDLVLLVLGDQWLAVVPIFRALGAAAFVGTLNLVTSWALVPLGQTGRELWLSACGAVVTVSAFAIGIRWGVIGLAIAFSVSELVKRPIQIIYAFQRTPLRLMDLWSAIWRPAMACGAASIAVLVLQPSWTSLPLIFRLLLSGSVFATMYAGALFLVPGGREFSSKIIMAARYLRPGA